MFPCPANEDFDKLCFDFGVELDEDVRELILSYKVFSELRIQNTEEVEAAIKKGLPAERPVRPQLLEDDLSHAF